MKKMILLFFLMMLCPLTWAEENFLSALPSNWQFYQTPDKTLHYTDIATNEWQVATVPKLLKTNPKYGIYGWYQVHFDWKNKPTDQLQLYIQSIRYADETWLNGQKIGAIGTITQPWQFFTGNPQNLPRKYPIPAALLQMKHNTLAIKVHLGIGEVWAAMYPGGVGIGGDKIGIGSKSTINRLYTQQILKNTMIDTVLIVLGIVDIFMIIFLFRRSIHHFHEFWWLLIGSIAMMSGSLLLDYFYVLEMTFNAGNLFLILSLLSLPFVNAMYFWTIHKNIDKRLVLGIAGFWAVVVLLLILPMISDNSKNYLWLIWSALTTVLLSYCLFSAISGVQKKYTGARFQLFGLVVFILSIRTQWLPVDLFEHRNIIVGTLILRYSFLFSYFQRINQMSQDYQQLSGRLLSTIENHKQDIARDLHDDLGQHLSAAKLRLLLYYQGDKGDKENSIEFIKQEINAAVQSVRELMQGLHPQILEHYPFIQALQRESDRLSKLYKVAIYLNMPECAVKLHKTTEKHLFRIFQETLHNAIKHGKASEVHAELRVEKHQIHLQVNDNGMGFDTKQPPKPQDKRGFGLVSLHERVALINGRIYLHSLSGKGTLVVISLPRLRGAK